MTVALITNTELAATIDEKWRMDILEALYAASTVVPRVLNASGDVKQSGDIINVTVDVALTVQTVGTDGTFNLTAITPTSVALAVDQWKLVQLGTTNRSEWQSFWDIKSSFPKSAGKALAAVQDASLLALYTGLTGLAQVGSEGNPVTFGKVTATSALLRLAQANIPMNDLTFVVPPDAIFAGILQETDFTDASMTGAGQSALVDGKWKMNIVGVPIAMTTQASVVGGAVIKAALIHKNAWAIAIQKNQEIERFSMAAGGFSGRAVKMETLYGTKTIRSDHGCVINIAKA